MFIGSTRSATGRFALDANLIYARDVRVVGSGYLYLMSADLDGLGGAPGVALLRPVLYERGANTRVAVGDEISIASGSPAAYRPLTFPTVPLLTSGTYAVGYQVGGDSDVASAAYDGEIGPSVRNGSTRVVTPGTEVKISTATRTVSSIILIARDANVGPVDIGDATINAPGAQVTVRLRPGETHVLTDIDLSTVYVDAQVAGDGVAWVTEETTGVGVQMSAPYQLAPPLLLVPTMNSLNPSLYATTSDPWSWGDVSRFTEEYLAALPWEESQSIFGTQGPVSNSARSAKLSWHGSGFHPSQGAFAVVKEGGPFEAMLGERLKLTYNGRAIMVYVTDSSPDVDEELTVTRQAFVHLAAPALDRITAVLEVLGS
jgi:hypothetical protein